MSGHNDRPIIVIGCARSGTTLLQLMIHAHRRLAMPAETRFVTHLFETQRQYGDLRDPANVDLVADAIVERKKSRLSDMGLDGPEVRARLHETPPTLGSMIGTVFQMFAEKHGKQRWGDKRPSYIRHVPRLMALFPDVQFVHIIRDGRDSISSLKNMPWFNRSFNSAVYRWKEALDVGAWASRELRPDQYFEFRYEDLVADPRTQLQALCEYLEEEFDEAMLEPHKVDEVPDWKTWHPNTRRPVNKDAFERWRKDLTPNEIQLVEYAVGNHLTDHGYQLSLPAWRRRPPLQSKRRWDKHVVDMAAIRQRQRDKDARMTRRYPHPIASIVTEGQRQSAQTAGWLDDYPTPAAGPAERGTE